MLPNSKKDAKKKLADSEPKTPKAPGAKNAGGDDVKSSPRTPGTEKKKDCCD